MSTRRFGLWLAAAMLATLALQLWAYWPGVMIWDSIHQYERALSGRYDDWHPPAFEWLWRQLIPLGGGPTPMILLQMLLYWGGLGLLASWALRQGRRGLAIAIAATALLPISFAWIGVVIKDTMFAGLLLSATGLLAWRQSGAPRWFAGVAILLLIAASTLRFNALPATLPLLVALLPIRWRDTPKHLALSAAIATIPLVLAVPVVNKLLHAEKSGVELSLLIYDLGGITENSGVDVFPKLDVDDPVAVNHGCYSTISWDTYAWWAEDPCEIGFEEIRDLTRRHGRNLYADWFRAVAAHPLAYAEHRLMHFNSNIRLAPPVEQNLPAFAQSDPNPWHFHVPPKRLRDAIQAIVLWANDEPIGWPAFWMAVAAGVLILSPKLPSRQLLRPLALSSLLYGLGYLPVSVASEMRYHLWTMIAALIAAVVAASDIAAGAPVARRRLALAATPALLVTVIGMAWRFETL